MSRRTAEASKAIREAWDKEQNLVLGGKGTRNWTPEQQQSIIDKGKAYDDEGKAFEGQHMKSVAEYPEYQGTPDNIQFLTKEEHLAAHKGSWQNPTNWYYDPVTKEFTEFGADELIPCKILDLNNPIAMLSTKESVAERKDNNVEEKAKDESKEDKPVSVNDENISRSKEKQKSSTGPKTAPPYPHSPRVHKRENFFLRGLKTAGRFIVDHPIESLEIAGVVISGGIELVSTFRGKRNTNHPIPTTSSRNNDDPAPRTDIATQIADIVEKATRSSPEENDVSGHRQRYHTKDGVIWKDKSPYHRGGKDN